MERHVQAPVQLYRVLIAILSLGVLLSGCAGSPEVAVPPDVAAATTELSQLPPDIGLARTIAREGCINAAGYPVVAGRIIEGATRAQEGATVGIWASEDRARSGGYSTTLKEESSTPFQAFGDALPEPQRNEYFHALMGDKTNVEKYTTDAGMVFSRAAEGCFADSDREIFGTLQDAMAIELFINDLTAQLREGGASLSAGEYIGDYERCMAQAGSAVHGLHADTLAGEKFGRYRALGEPPRAEEQELAVTDFRCQDSSGLAANVREANLRTAGEWLKKNEQRILTLKETLAHSVERAQNIINGHG